MAEVQEITIGAERAVLVPLDTWRALIERLEDLEDELLFDVATADGEQDLIEHDDLCRRLGLSPLRYLRRLAGLTQTELARRTRLSQAFIARVEAGEKRLSDASRKRIARVLRVPMHKLVW
jgi:DNA-binding XRE family transcriptional regulator